MLRGSSGIGSISGAPSFSICGQNAATAAASVSCFRRELFISSAGFSKVSDLVIFGSEIL
jgi:hypothetical protein